MEEINGFNIAVKVLGERIAHLESELRVERYYKEEYKKKADMLDAENNELISKLEKVQRYIEGMEE